MLYIMLRKKDQIPLCSKYVVEMNVSTSKYISSLPKYQPYHRQLIIAALFAFWKSCYKLRILLINENSLHKSRYLYLWYFNTREMMMSEKAIIESNLIVIIVNLKTFFHFQQNQSEIANMGIRSLSGFGRSKAVGICI